jgi:hypothetical protein
MNCDHGDSTTSRFDTLFHTCLSCFFSAFLRASSGLRPVSGFLYVDRRLATLITLTAFLRRLSPLSPPPATDAPCTHCLRHGDPMHAQE